MYSNDTYLSSNAWFKSNGEVNEPKPKKMRKRYACDYHKKKHAACDCFKSSYHNIRQIHIAPKPSKHDISYTIKRKSWPWQESIVLHKVTPKSTLTPELTITSYETPKNEAPPVYDAEVIDNGMLMDKLESFNNIENFWNDFPQLTTRNDDISQEISDLCNSFVIKDWSYLHEEMERIQSTVDQPSVNESDRIFSNLVKTFVFFPTLDETKVQE